MNMKSSFKAFVFLVSILSLGTFAMGGKPTPKEGTQIEWIPGLKAKKQETPSWCWAAAIQMVTSKFYKSAPEQCAIVGRAMGQECCNLPENKRAFCKNYGGEKILSTLRSFTGEAYVKYGVHFDSVVSDVKKGYPVIVVNNPTGAQHALVAYGTYIGKNNLRYIVLWEPYNNKNITISEKSALWDYSLHSR